MKRRQVCGPSQIRPVGLGRRAPPTYRQRREWLRLSESAKGRVQPPGEPVKVRRTRETKSEDPAFLGLHVLVTFACALGESALPFMGSPTTAGQPYRPTFSLQKSKFNKHRSTILPPSRRWRQVGGPRRIRPTACSIKIYEEPKIITLAPTPSRPRSRAMGHGHASMPPRSIPHWPLLLTPVAHPLTT
jgi:hypothetical protein